MKGLEFTVDCYRCGGELEPLATGRSNPAWQQMVVRCEKGHEWQVSVELRQVLTVSASKKRDYRERVNA